MSAQPLFEPVYSRSIIRVIDSADGGTKFVQPMHVVSFQAVDNEIHVHLSLSRDDAPLIAARLTSRASAGATLMAMLNAIFGDKNDAQGR